MTDYIYIYIILNNNNYRILADVILLKNTGN